MFVTRDVSQPEMSALKLRRPSRLKSSLMSVTPETSQHSMAPYFAVVEAAFEEYSSTAFVREAFHVKVWPVQAGGDGDGDGERAGGLGDGGLGEGGGGEGLNGGGKGLGGGGEGDGGERMRSMRCSETPRISSSVRPRGHTTTSAIAKSDFSWPWVPPLTHSDTPPVPPAAMVPTSTPFTSFSCDPALLPHMTNQFVFGLTWF